MKYYIIPKHNFEETVNATSADEAIEKFATTMELDMNIYFDVVSEDEYLDYKLGRDLAEQRRMHIEFATNELNEWYKDDYISDEDIAEIAEESWNYYRGEKKGAEGFTQYECIEKALDDWRKEKIIKITNIEWDVDDDADLELLPEEIEIPYIEIEDVEVEDFLSDRYGFCIRSLVIEKED